MKMLKALDHSAAGRASRTTSLDRYLVLGGAGLVGKQVCRHIAMQFAPSSIVVAALHKQDAVNACSQLKKEFNQSNIEFIPHYGNIFGPQQFTLKSTAELTEDQTVRKALIKHFYGDFQQAYDESAIKHLLQTHRPQVVVDCINTATGVAYQNVFDKTRAVIDYLDPNSKNDLDQSRYEAELEQLILSQPTQQLIHHVRILHKATSELDVETYLKVGTTGTGGLGMDVVYTHAEESPSEMLLSKTSSAFAHTGLLFLLARTQNAPIVKEIKPAAMIGYGGFGICQVKDKNMNSSLFVPKKVDVSGQINLSEDVNNYEVSGSLTLPVVDAGENGLFSEGEFSCISSYGHMEFLTPEEIAEAVVLELVGANSGYDIIASLDSTIMKPSYKGGLVRSIVLDNVRQQDITDSTKHLPSISIGRLGPPMLSKILFEGYLLKEAFGSFKEIASVKSPKEMMDRLKETLTKSVVYQYAPSVGIPILTVDGDVLTLIRGPFINIPPKRAHISSVSLEDPTQVNEWAKRGWVDLRPQNLSLWIERCKKIESEISRRRSQNGLSSAFECSAMSYNERDFEIGSVAAWILSNEFGAVRIK